MMILHSADLKTLNMNLPELLRKRGALPDFEQLRRLLP